MLVSPIQTCASGDKGTHRDPYITVDVITFGSVYCDRAKNPVGGVCLRWMSSTFVQMLRGCVLFCVNILKGEFDCFLFVRVYEFRISILIVFI